MAAASVALPLRSEDLLKSPSVTVEKSDILEPESTEPLTVDHLIRIRAQQSGFDEPLIAYPNAGTRYVEYSARDLHVLVERAACVYSSFIPQRTSSDQPVLTVGLLGPSDLDYLVTFLALTRLGHTSLLLSTRISNEAYESLLSTTKASAFLYHEDFSWAADFVKSKLPNVTSHQISTIEEIRNSNPLSLRPSNLDLHREANNLCFIIHSSGSTGLPKPIFQTHRACLYSYSQSFGLVSHITLPLYHNHGISCLFRAIYARKKIYIHNARLPLARQHLVATLKEHPDVQILYGVPYALKLLSETDEGIDLLRSLDIVMFGGSACPKPIGDRLVAKGVRLVGHYGATEVGQLMTSFRDFETDFDWDWLRVPDYLKPFLSMEPRGSNVFELVVKDGWKSKVASNREDGSYATKDLFEPHQTLSDAWKYLSRLDDTVTLENGEKVNPVVIEGLFRQHEQVAEAVVFGVNKPQIGVFLIATSEAAREPNAIIDAVLPLASEMNESVPAWSRISRDMIFVLPAETAYRRTDKGTVIRAAFYKDFAAQIDAAYVDEQSGDLTLPRPELLDFLRATLQKQTTLRSSTKVTDSTDLFSLGVDSLQAMQIRTQILRQIDLKGNTLGRNFVFDFPSLDLMADEIIRIQGGVAQSVTPSVEERMSALIEKYSVFPQHVPQAQRADGKYIVVTGATGSLGAHVVAQLVQQEGVRRVYCLVRADSVSAACSRVRKSLQARRLYHRLDVTAQAKFVSIPSSLHEERLGLSEARYNDIASNVTHVLHLAWSVNFNKKLESFEGDCIVGLHNLITLALAARRPEPATFNFCSSVSATAATSGGFVPEALPASLTYAQSMGYAQSKHVAEHICLKASGQTGMKARVLRTGQIIGDSKHGVWNHTEAIPLMIQTALTIGALPKLDETPSWLPVDTVANTLIEISCSAAGSGCMNVQNPKMFHWTHELLPLLRSAGLQFEEVSQREWVDRLRKSNSDPVANPPIKLLDFFVSKYDTDVPRQSLSYATEMAQGYSLALQNAGTIDTALMTKIVSYLKTQCWLPSATCATKPVAVIVGGPCGAGKSTVAAAIAKQHSLPTIEGDDLHTRKDRQTMEAGTSLDDAQRLVWLSRLQGAIMDNVSSSRSPAAVVTCSALKASYRNVLRELDEIAGIRTCFVMLATDNRDILKVRLAERKGHYMKEPMVDKQVECLQPAEDHEIDVAFVDAARDRSVVFDEVNSIVGDALSH